MMNEIQYINGDLFKDVDSILLHACNCKKNWGSGVAVKFAELFPSAYKEHKTFDATPGDIQIINGDGTIVCLFTSDMYGRYRSNNMEIIKNTARCIMRLCEHYEDVCVSIASPKINSGHFGVPWEATEQVINYYLNKNSNISWKVYYL